MTTVYNILYFICVATGIAFWSLVSLVIVDRLVGMIFPSLNQKSQDRVLEILSEVGEMSGRDLQERLIRECVMSEWSKGVPFYTAMARMEDYNLIKRYVKNKVVGDGENRLMVKETLFFKV